MTFLIRRTVKSRLGQTGMTVKELRQTQEGLESHMKVYVFQKGHLTPVKAIYTDTLSGTDDGTPVLVLRCS